MLKYLCSLTIILFCSLSFANEEVVGDIDTVGGTVYDWQFNGPSLQRIVNDPQYGIPIGWMRSITGVYPTFIDRNMGYNFYDYTSRLWAFNDPTNYMNSGVNVFPERAGFGNLDVDPMTKINYISATTGSGVVVARDSAPGIGIFEYCYGPQGYFGPVISLTNNGWVHIAMLDTSPQRRLYYSRIRTWCNWETPMQLSPNPGYPSYNLAASKRSNKVIITAVNIDTFPNWLYYWYSSDGGNTWEPPIQLPSPPAFGPDTLVSFHWRSPSPFFDIDDNFHIVIVAMPTVRDTLYSKPVEIWDYCPNRMPLWGRVCRVTAESLAGNFGYNDIIASRPTLSQNIQNRDIYAVWEQFDSLNLEPITQLLRSDIYVAKSTNNGVTWGGTLRITNPDQTSKHFPSSAGRVHNDTIYISYLIDLQAGFYVRNQGQSTNNPIVVHKVPVSLVGIEENQLPQTAIRLPLEIYPNPAKSFFMIRVGETSQSRLSDSHITIKIYDIAGKLIKVVDKATSAQEHRREMIVSLKGIKSGVYFVKVGDLIEKLVVKK